jgi:tetratricopeptide (TPR) repeat protein
MRLYFICDNHRTYFNQQPEIAVQSCLHNCEIAESLYQQGRWEEALPYVGCAYETAEILLINDVCIAGNPIEWFLHSLEGLTETLKRLGQIEDCLEFYRAAINRLRLYQRHSLSMKVTIDIEIDRLNGLTKILSGSYPATAKIYQFRRANQRAALH